MKLGRSAIWFLFAILISIIFFVWFNYTKIFFNIDFSDIKSGVVLPENSGRFGDVYGGLNTLFSGVAFAALFISILFQSAELTATREEMKSQGDQFIKQTEMLDKQSFESSLFQLMSFNNEVIQSLTMQKSRRMPSEVTGFSKEVIDIYNGRQVFYELYKDMCEFVHQSTVPSIYKDRSTSPSDVYVKFYQKHEDKLGPYFNGFYQTLKLIDEASYDTMIKKKYIDLVVAQASKYEMYFLFYHGLSQFGRNNLKYLLEKYGFFELFPKDIHILWRDMLEYNISVFGCAGKERFVGYLLAYTRVEEQWLSGRKLIAYVDGDKKPFDITNEITNISTNINTKITSNVNIINGVRSNKIIWIELVSPELTGSCLPAGTTNQTHQDYTFELPSKRYITNEI